MRRHELGDTNEVVAVVEGVGVLLRPGPSDLRPLGVRADSCADERGDPSVGHPPQERVPVALVEILSHPPSRYSVLAECYKGQGLAAS